MNQETFNLVSAILLAATVAAGVATVIVYYCQLRVMQQTLDRMVRTLRSQVSADLTTKLNGYNQVEINHPKIHDFYNQPYDDRGDMSHAGELVTDMRFAVYEEAFSQYRIHDLIDESSWKVWERIMVEWIKRPFFRGYWANAKPFFSESFAKLVDSLLEAK